jgi:hypothetical protein
MSYKTSITVKKGISEAALSGTPMVLIGIAVRFANDHGYDISTNDAVEIITAASIVIAFVRRSWRNFSKQCIGEK